MTFPFNIRIGSIEIPSHLIFEILAYTIGFRYFLFLRKKNVDLINTKDRLWILVGAAAGAMLFSKLIGIFEDPVLFENNSANPVYYFASKTIVGGLLGGLLGVELIKKFLNVKTSSGDLMTYPTILAMMIGRVGCFLAGTQDATYGVETKLPWGIDFGDGIKRHPTNLYEILFLALLWIFIFQLEKRNVLTNGARFKIFMTTYLLFRFFIEFIKPDHIYLFGLGLIQLACIIGILYYYKTIIFPRTMLQNKINA